MRLELLAKKYAINPSIRRKHFVTKKRQMVLVCEIITSGKKYAIGPSMREKEFCDEKKG